MVARAIDWKYALGSELADPGFDPSVLSKFRARLVEHGLEQVVFDKMLEVLAAKGLVGAGGKQRTESTHVASAVRDLNRLALAGESVRACLEALAAAAPDWLASVIEVSEWSTRYGARVHSWRLPTSATKRERLALLYRGDALALLRAIHAETAPPWLRELPAVQVLRTMLIQNYYLHTNARGREVIGKREPEKQGFRLPITGSARPMTSTPAGPPRARTCSGAATSSTSPKPATPPTTPPTTRNDGDHGNDHGTRGQGRARRALRAGSARPAATEPDHQRGDHRLYRAGCEDDHPYPPRAGPATSVARRTLR